MYLFNIDTLSFTFDICSYDDNITNIVEDLETKKQLSISYRDSNTTQKVYINLNNMEFYILPNGAKGYAYILHNNNYELKIAKTRSNNKSNYPVFIRIKQEALWSAGAQSAYKNIYNFVTDVFGSIISEKVNRCDLCCHTDNIDFANIPIDNFKTRVNKKNVRFEHNKITGFEFAVRDSEIYARIYNKSIEIAESRKQWFVDIWNRGNADVFNVWNIEFELKRDFMRSNTINTVNELFDNISNLWNYLVYNWLILTLNDKTRKENSTIASEWKKLENGFQYFNPSKPFIRQSKINHYAKENIIPQLAGYLTSYSAFENITDLYTVFEPLSADLTLYFNKSNKSFKDLVIDKQTLLKGVD